MRKPKVIREHIQDYDVWDECTKQITDAVFTRFSYYFADIFGEERAEMFTNKVKEMLDEQIFS